MTAMSQAAAFFDLDRTLIRRASGEIYSRAARTTGFVSRSVPGEGLLYGLFNAYGEVLPAMLIARQGPRVAKGRRRADAQATGELAADELLAAVEPGVAAVFDRHRRQGRPLVLATTTPYDWVKPLADRLGMDDVIATRYAVDDDGRYTGEFDGPFVWSTGKLAAVQDWAARHDVELSASWAYSDSVYDVPLLRAVGHPVAVNPDPRLILAAALHRWPTESFGHPPPPAEGALDVQRIAFGLVSPWWFPYAQFDIAGLENLPTDGPTVVVGNHRSYFDVAAMAMVLARLDRPVRFLGKREVFDAPVIGKVAAALGGIPVDRASGSAAPLRRAEEAIAAGDVVAMMPQGTIPRGTAFFEPELRGRYGAARLARATDAHIVPVGLWGTEHVWPRSSRLPLMWQVADPPTVRIRVGQPVRLTGRADLDADTRTIMAAIVDQLPAEARRHRRPSAEELAKTLPPGYQGDPRAEAQRRPGTD